MDLWSSPFIEGEESFNEKKRELNVGGAVLWVLADWENT